ncbi:MAG: mannitol dehydrogenase family protein, partial [Corynebacterium variabile]
MSTPTTSTLPHLGTAQLDAVAATGAAVPGYDRAAVTPGIVHIGVGGFHRAHQAMY